MFFQIQPQMKHYFRKHSMGSNEIQIHLHSFYELQCCTAEELLITVSGREYRLQAGEAALIFPYQPHSFSKSNGTGFLFTFDAELIGTFANQYANFLPRHNVFPFSYDLSAVSEESGLYEIKAFLYAMCHQASKMEYEYAPEDSRVLLEKIFILTEESFTNSDFSLKELAKLLGYDYGYISKYFHQKTNLKYGFYLNQRRIFYATKMLNTGKTDSIGDIAFACGYGSVRSFNRNFKGIQGATPKEYISQYKDQMLIDHCSV